MKQLELYGKKCLFFLIGIILIAFLLSILNYFNFLNKTITHLLSNAFTIIFCIYSGTTLGKKASKNGYLEGLKIGGLFILILLFLNIIFFSSPFSWKRILYYLIILATCIISSMIGINKKKQS